MHHKIGYQFLASTAARRNAVQASIGGAGIAKSHSASRALSSNSCTSTLEANYLRKRSKQPIPVGWALTCQRTSVTRRQTAAVSSFGTSWIPVYWYDEMEKQHTRYTSLQLIYHCLDQTMYVVSPGVSLSWRKGKVYHENRIHLEGTREQCRPPAKICCE